MMGASMNAPNTAPTVYNRKNPFPARMLVNRLLTGQGSEKDTRHYEFSLAGSGLTYECGDSLAVIPTNSPALVEELLTTLGHDGTETVPGHDKQPLPLREALLHHYQITEPSKPFLKAVAEKEDDFLKDLADPDIKTDLDMYIWGRDYIDVLRECQELKFAPGEFAGLLRKLQPRLYSIASSQKVYPEEVHLTVATVDYESHGRKREGVCSTFLARRVTPETPVPVFVHTAKGFRMPEDPSTDMIMVGPGTGIAPFRAFLQERQATGATGKNWLFFGEQRRDTDFLYREEFEAMQKAGVLHRFDTAFSRDQDYKIYVQHRMLENSRDLFDYLENGAYFYVCGDAKRMAADVDQALRQIVEREKNVSEEAAAEYVQNLRKEKRYRKDVY